MLFGSQPRSGRISPHDGLDDDPLAVDVLTDHALFRQSGGVVYILPDTKPLETVFPGVLLSQRAAQPANRRRS